MALVEGGSIFASAPDGAGGFFIGGNFEEVGGLTRMGLAHILPSGNVDPAFDPNPNGTVRALAVSGGVLYAGGGFDQIGGQARSRVAKLSATSGNAFTAWNAGAVDGALSTVDALAVSGSELYVGGSGFTMMGGLPRTRIAKLSTTSGNAFSAWNPNANQSVRALVVVGASVYVGGSFNGANSIGGQARNRIAKLSATTGNAFSAWNPDASDEVDALEVSDGAVYAGGEFLQIGTLTRNYVAKLSATSGNAFSAFNADANGGVDDLLVSGTGVFVGGEFNGANSIGGQTRNYLAKLSTASGNAFSSFDPNPNASVSALALTGSALYVGGGFDSINRVARNRLAALDSTGAPTEFNPDVGGGPVWSLAATGSAVFLGGDFTTVGGTGRNRLAKVSGTTGNLFTGFDPNANDTVWALATDGTYVYAGGDFTEIAGEFPDRLAKLSATTGVRQPSQTEVDGTVYALALDGPSLFIGGAFTSTGFPRQNIAKVTTADLATYASFNPGADNAVFALEVDGSTLFAGGRFLNIGGQPRGRIAKLTTATGSVFSGFNTVASDQVNALDATSSALYVGGDFNGLITIGGKDRQRLAALSKTTGNAFSSFNPQIDDNRVFAVSAGSSALYAGGTFTQVAGEARPGFAEFAGAP